MKKLLFLSAALMTSGMCLAQEIAHVISSTPIQQQVGVPRQVCSTEVGSLQQCAMQIFYENQTVAYNVIYEVGAKQYSVQLPNDPGPTLLIQVGPASASTSLAQHPGTVTYAQPMSQQPIYVVPGPEVYPGYYELNYFLPFTLGLGLGWWGGSHGHRHWH